MTASRRKEAPKKPLDTKAHGTVAALGSALGHEFADPSLLARALTHPSADGAPTRNNQRLEFLGDRVLGLIIAALLMKRYPGEPEGELSLRLTALVRGETLTQVARDMDLGSHLVLGPSEDEAAGRNKPASLANALEAVIAALYLDGGLAAAEAFVLRRFEPLIDQALPPAKDAKTALQEWAQARQVARPTYRTTSVGGSPHEPVFEIEVSIDGAEPVRATGGSKREAEHAAARLLLDDLLRRDHG